MGKNIVKTSAMIHFIDEHGIMRITIMDDVDITEETVLESLNARKKMFNGKKHPVIVDTRNLKYIPRHTLSVVADTESSAITSAMAIVINSPTQRLIGNFFLNFEKPPYPTKIFTSTEQAIQWLKMKKTPESGTKEKQEKQSSTYNEKNKILDYITNLINLDFSKRLELDSKDPHMTAIAVGLNMLGEELQRKHQNINQMLESRTAMLIESEKRLKDIALSSGEWIWEIDKNSEFVFVAGNTLKIIGYTNEELLGITPFDIMPKEEKDRIEAIFSKIKEKGARITDLENTILTKNGSLVAMLTNGVPIFDQQQNVIGYRGMDKNITQKKIREKDLISAIAREKAAKDANSLKTEFLSNISHELRTPMHGILSFAQYGIDDIKSKNATQEEILNDFIEIRDSGARLLNLLNDLWDLSLLEAGKVPYNMRTENVAILLDTLFSELSPFAQSKKISLGLKTKLEHCNAFFDHGKIQQVLRNLLSNAIEFSNHGEEISVELSEIKEHENEYLKISVINIGEKIPDEKLHMVFDKFFKTSKTREIKAGTGLGLSISKSIINDHNGQIWVDNSQPEKTILSFTLPRNEMKKYVLLIHNNHECFKDIEVQIKEMDFAIITATNVEQALKKIKEYNIATVIVDAIIPNTSGIELLASLQKKDNKLKALLLTEKNNLQSDELVELGNTIFARKPLSTDQLERFFAMI